MGSRQQTPKKISGGNVTAIVSPCIGPETKTVKLSFKGGPPNCPSDSVDHSPFASHKRYNSRDGNHTGKKERKGVGTNSIKESSLVVCFR
jgi:hypothetical protein